MRGSYRRRKGWLRWGCMGVAIVLGVLVLWFVVLSGSALWKNFNESVESRSLHQPVAPRPAAAPGEASPADRPGEGKVVLDLEVGDFAVVPGQPGEGIRVEAEYDVNSYELTQTHETAHDGRWVYRVEFRQTGLLHDNGLRALFGGAFPKIRIQLPPDVPLELEGSFAMGGTFLQLGGLWLTSVDLNPEKGGCAVDFGRPTVEPLERLTIRGRQGGFSASRIGNASPREVRIDHRMGDMGVGLHGAWRNDADIRIRHMMGGGGVTFPDDVLIDWPEGESRTVGSLARPEIAGPTLSVTINSFLSRVHTEVLPASGPGAAEINVTNE